MVVVPPIYLANSKATPVVLGLPWSVFYMLLNGALMVALVAALWLVESARGELEQYGSLDNVKEQAHGN